MPVSANPFPDINPYQMNAKQMQEVADGGGLLVRDEVNNILHIEKVSGWTQFWRTLCYFIPGIHTVVQHCAEQIFLLLKEQHAAASAFKEQKIKRRGGTASNVPLCPDLPDIENLPQVFKKLAKETGYADFSKGVTSQKIQDLDLLEQNKRADEGDKKVRRDKEGQKAARPSVNNGVDEPSPELVEAQGIIAQLREKLQSFNQSNEFNTLLGNANTILLNDKSQLMNENVVLNNTLASKNQELEDKNQKLQALQDSAAKVSTLMQDKIKLEEEIAQLKAINQQQDVTILQLKKEQQNQLDNASKVVRDPQFASDLQDKIIEIDKLKQKLLTQESDLKELGGLRNTLQYTIAEQATRITDLGMQVTQLSDQLSLSRQTEYKQQSSLAQPSILQDRAIAPMANQIVQPISQQSDELNIAKEKEVRELLEQLAELAASGQFKAAHELILEISPLLESIKGNITELREQFQKLKMKLGEPYLAAFAKSLWQYNFDKDKKRDGTTNLLHWSYYKEMVKLKDLLSEIGLPLTPTQTKVLNEAQSELDKEIDQIEIKWATLQRECLNMSPFDKFTHFNNFAYSSDYNAQLAGIFNEVKAQLANLGNQVLEIAAKEQEEIRKEIAQLTQEIRDLPKEGNREKQDQNIKLLDAKITQYRELAERVSSINEELSWSMNDEIEETVKSIESLR